VEYLAAISAKPQQFIPVWKMKAIFLQALTQIGQKNRPENIHVEAHTYHNFLKE
jgi:hypothetical protein